MGRFWGFMFTVTFIMFIITAVFMDVRYDVLRFEAIERGYAQYCEKTGIWHWKGECE